MHFSPPFNSKALVQRAWGLFIQHAIFQKQMSFIRTKAFAQRRVPSYADRHRCVAGETKAPVIH